MKLNFTEDDIFEAEFKTSFRGYDKEEVDDFLDKIIEDYATMQSMLSEMSNTVIKQPEVTQNSISVAEEKPEKEEVAFDFIRPKKNVTSEVPPLSSLFNFDAEEDTEDVEELLSVSQQEKSLSDNTNYDLIQRLAQLEKEVANLRNKS